MNFHLYADDTQLYLSFDSCVSSTRDTAIIQLESCIAEIKAWMLSNRLKLNGDKTEFLQFLPISIHTKCPVSDPIIRIGSDSVTLSDQAKNLGVIFDPELSMSAHITSVCKAANCQLYRISRIKKYLTPQALKIVIHALVASKIDYCNSLLVGLPETQTKRLQNIMNSAARLISGVRKFEHITPTLKDLHWLPVNIRIIFKLLCLTYKALNGLAPPYLADLLKSYIPTRSLRSAEKGLLCAPKSRTKTFGERSFICAAPLHYNALPLDIRQAKTLDSFKSRLKTHFFRLAYTES